LITKIVYTLILDSVSLATITCTHIDPCGNIHNAFVCLMVFNATFNNISVISWRSVLFVEETGYPWENHRPMASHWQTLSHNVVPIALIEIRTHNISVDRYWLHR